MRQNCHIHTKLLAEKASSGVIGFDGFVDSLYEAVATRKSAHSYAPIPTIHEFSERIATASGKGTNIELVLKETKLGGNAPILANCLVQLGLKPTLIAPCGKENPLALFKPLTDAVQYISLGDPGLTDAIEFDDGKIMLGKHASILSITDQTIVDCVGEFQLRKLFDNITYFASVNWTMLVGTTAFWNYLQKSIFPKLQNCPKFIFIDLADPAKRTKNDLKAALKSLQGFEKFSPVTLSLNELEAKQLLSLYGISTHEKSLWKKQETLDACIKLQKLTALSQIFIHTTRFGASGTTQEAHVVSGYFVKKPRITTGGGDNCNGGFIFAKVAGLSDEECLNFGMRTAALYVQTGKSPSLADLS